MGSRVVDFVEKHDFAIFLTWFYLYFEQKSWFLRTPPYVFFQFLPVFVCFFRVPVLTNLHLVIAFCQNGSENVHFRSRITWNLPSESTLLDSAHFFQSGDLPVILMGISLYFPLVSLEFPKNLKGFPVIFYRFFLIKTRQNKPLIKANQVDQVFPDQNPSKQAAH